MKSRAKLSIVFIITGIIVLSLPFVLVYVDAHFLAKLLWSILAVLDIVIAVQTYKGLREQSETDLFSKKGLYFMVAGLVVYAIIFIVLMRLK